MTLPASSLMISFAAAGAIEPPIVSNPVKKQMANDDGIRISPAPWLWPSSRLSQILAQRHNASIRILLQPKHFLIACDDEVGMACVGAFQNSIIRIIFEHAYGVLWFHQFCHIAQRHCYLT